MEEDFRRTEGLLRRGINLTRQGSYNRRAPSRESIPLLEQAIAELKSWIQIHGETPKALRLLAVANEALLNYTEAAKALERAIKVSACPDRRDVKRLAAYREATEMWETLSLKPTELSDLGLYLREKLLDSAPERSLRWTKIWLKENRPDQVAQILASIKRLGHYSDYEILHNLIPG
jgi:tetratricopeptide (TPR) repeat protein